MSCSSPHFCVAGDNNGDLLTSINPTKGRRAWKLVVLPSNGDSPGILSGLSCGARSLCVGVDQSTGEGFIDDVVTSTKPTSSGSWHATQLAADPSVTINAVACPSQSLCIVGDTSGLVETSRDPAGGESRWASASIDPGRSITSLSCVSSTLCVAAENGGRVLVGTLSH